MIHHIVVPLDGSLLAETALPHAFTLARQAHAILHIVQVIPQGTGRHTTADLDTVEAVSDYLDSVEQQVCQAGIPVRTVVRYGHPVDQILLHAARVHADLVVMATHGRSGLQRLILGSVAEGMVRRANCPVVLIHGTQAVPRYRRILVPFDGTPSSESILPVVTELAREHHADLVLLRAVAPLIIPEAPLSPLTYVPDFNQVYANDMHDGERYLEAIARPLRATGLQVETQCRFGEPRDVIADAVQKVKPDLIVMTTHARSLVERAVFGSVAEHVLRYGRVPVILYHAHAERQAHSQPQEKELRAETATAARA